MSIIELQYKKYERDTKQNREYRCSQSFRTVRHFISSYCRFLFFSQLIPTFQTGWECSDFATITLGRKNYLFCGNHEAAGNMAVICSLPATCKAHDVNPRLYLNGIIADMPYMEKVSQEELLEMLPHRWKLRHPEAIITKEQRQYHYH